jgi:hypothetical protein
MEEPILQAIEEVWRHRRAALETALAEALDGLRELLRLDEYHRHGHDPDQLERSLGPLAGDNLDLGSLSRVLERGTRSRAMAPERVRRVQELIPTLDEMRKTWSSTPLETACIDIESDESEIRERAEAYLGRLAQVFRSLRIAQLEIRSKYQAQTHDAMFARFDWRQLGPAEVQLSPPFLVLARLDGDRGARVHKIMSLLETGMPIKALALRSSLRQIYSGGSRTRVPSKMTVETLPLALRGVYFRQTHAAATDFQKQLAQGLSAPRPTVISVLRPQEQESDESFAARAERAVRARAFPSCLYDPDRDERFVLCFDLSGNPSPELAWTTETLSSVDPEGQPVEMKEAFTLAHFAASDSELEAELIDPPPSGDSLVPLTDYLGFSRRQQMGKLPFVSLQNADGGVIRKVVSRELALQCAERLHLWRTLQEISGIDNPFVVATKAKVERELSAQRDAQLEGLRQEMEKDAARREKAAIASAVRKLVAELTGVKPSGN